MVETNYRKVDSVEHMVTVAGAAEFAERYLQTTILYPQLIFCVNRSSGGVPVGTRPEPPIVTTRLRFRVGNIYRGCHRGRLLKSHLYSYYPS